jgi:hypothetical protein
VCFRCGNRPDHGIGDRLAPHLPGRALLPRHARALLLLSVRRLRRALPLPAALRPAPHGHRGRRASLRRHDVQRVSVPAAAPQLSGQHAGVSPPAAAHGSQRTSAATPALTIASPRVSRPATRLSGAVARGQRRRVSSSHVLSEEQEQQESKEPEQQQHASVVPVIPAAPPLLHKSSIRIESSSSGGEKKGEQQQQHYITNLQGQFHEVGADGKKGLAATLLAATGSRPSPLPTADRVTIVQNNGQRQPPPPSQQSSGYLSSGPFLGRHSSGGSGGVVVTVSAHCDAVASLRSSPEVDILAHL